MIYLQLFWEFFKAGLFAVGGGLATIPFLRDISQKTGWFTLGQLADMVAVSECTPGPVGVNMATYVGFLLRKVPGAVTATLGLIFPSIVVIIIVARILKAFQDSKYVKAAFYGLRPASGGLIAAACLSVGVAALSSKGLKDGIPAIVSGLRWKAVVLAVVMFFLMNHPKLKKLHPVVFLGASAVIGIVFSMGM